MSITTRKNRLGVSASILYPSPRVMVWGGVSHARGVPVDENPKREVNWRNVLLLCCLQLPLWYYACGLLTPIGGAPKLNSPEGRSLFREVLSHYFPELAKGTGVQK